MSKKKTSEEMTLERRAKKKAQQAGRKKGWSVSGPSTFQQIRLEKKEAYLADKEKREKIRLAMQSGQRVNDLIHLWLDTVDNRGLMVIDYPPLVDDPGYSYDEYCQALNELQGWIRFAPVYHLRHEGWDRYILAKAKPVKVAS